MDDKTDAKTDHKTDAKNVAVVLAAGSGRRMQSTVKKQYLCVWGKPILYYSLKVFQESEFIHEIILVAGESEQEFCKTEIVEKYGLTKVTMITAGGKERYHSVYNGLKKINGDGYVFIHDGARPCIDQMILEKAMESVREYRACVVGMPVKDTIKISDEMGFAESTPPRSRVWQIQTPQVFEIQLVKESYKKLMEELQDGCELSVTDDAMVVERESDVKVKLVEGSYSNIKITTPEDLPLAETFLKRNDS